MPPPRLEIIHAYRHLYRAAIAAVRNSSPAKHQVRSILRSSFRLPSEPNPLNNVITRASLFPQTSFEALNSFSTIRIQNTLTFLSQAKDYAGLEHKILRNILHMRWWRDQGSQWHKVTLMNQNTDISRELRRTIPTHFDATLVMLNETRGLCLRV